MNMQERDELLIRLDERTETMQKTLMEHLKKHWQISVVGLGGFITFISGVIFFFLS